MPVAGGHHFAGGHDSLFDQVGGPYNEIWANVFGNYVNTAVDHVLSDFKSITECYSLSLDYEKSKKILRDSFRETRVLATFAICFFIFLNFESLVLISLAYSSVTQFLMMLPAWYIESVPLKVILVAPMPVICLLRAIHCLLHLSMQSVKQGASCTADAARRFFNNVTSMSPFAKAQDEHMSGAPIYAV